MNIKIDCYDGGGIEVTADDYRPLSLHVRLVDDERAADIIGGLIYSLVLEWIQKQRQEGKVRVV